MFHRSSGMLYTLSFRNFDNFSDIFHRIIEKAWLPSNQSRLHIFATRGWQWNQLPLSQYRRTQSAHPFPAIAIFLFPMFFSLFAYHFCPFVFLFLLCLRSSVCVSEHRGDRMYRIGVSWVCKSVCRDTVVFSRGEGDNGLPGTYM